MTQQCRNFFLMTLIRGSSFTWPQTVFPSHCCIKLLFLLTPHPAVLLSGNCSPCPADHSPVGRSVKLLRVPSVPCSAIFIMFVCVKWFMVLLVLVQKPPGFSHRFIHF